MLGPFAPNLVVLRLFIKFELLAPEVNVSLKVLVGPESFDTSLLRTVKQVIVLLVKYRETFGWPLIGLIRPDANTRHKQLHFNMAAIQEQGPPLY